MDYENDFLDMYVDTSLGKIHYRYHSGAGEKIIFLHGFGMDTRVWTRLVEHLPNSLDITLIDLLGYGLSEAPDTDYTVSTQFQMLREFISLKNNGDSYIFGHSYGGWIAAYFAAQPYTCKGVILEDAAGMKNYFDSILEIGMANEYKEMQIKSAMKLNSNREHVLRSTVNSDFEEDQLTPELLRRINKRVLIIWGSDDDIIEKKFAIMLNNSIPNSQLEFVNGAKHNPHYSDPEKVALLILDFIGTSQTR